MVAMEAAEWFQAQAGDTLGRFALGPESISYDDLYHAVSFTVLSSCETPEELFSPRNHLLVELILSP